MNNQIAPTSATYPNAYTADATQKDLSEQSTKKKFLSYRTSVEPDFQKLINKNQAETKVLEGKIENMQKKLTEYLQYRAHDKLFIKPAPEKNHSNSIETNSIANKPLTPLSENSTTTDVNPQTTGLPSGSTTDSTVSSPILSTADHTSTFTPSIPTHTTVNDSSATATAQSVNTTQATNTTSPLTPTTALPPLGELLSKSVKITLMASLRDELEYYQQNRPIATGENSWGNITEIAQQPETIIGKRPDGPLPHIRDNQRPHPMIALSELISAIEARVTMYELFNLVLIVSSFTRAIKKSFPAVAGRYDNKLKQLADQIKSYLPSHDQDDTKRKRTRRELTEEEIKGIKFKFERLLDEFEEEPMKKEMKKFFQGFRQMRDTFTKAMYEGKNITKEPELKEFEEMFELMKNKETIKSGLEKYSQYIDKAIKDKDFYQAGQITFKVNILYNKIKNILEGYESNNPYHEFLVEFKALDATLDKLQSLANKAAALVDLDKIFYQAIAHDALALAYDKKLGYCFADVLSTAIAGQNGKYSTSLTSLAESILFGTGYTRLPVQIRITLQDVLYLKTPSSLKNHPASLGLNADSLYIAQAYKKAQTVRVAVDNELEITSRGFNSISDLIKKLLHQVDVDSLGTELVQFGVAPASNHIFYLAFSKSDNVFRLTVQDVQVGVITVTGNDLNQLQRNILMVLERFSDHYKIPLAPPTVDAVPIPGTGFCPLTRDILSPFENIEFENLELIQDSALTLKDIMTHRPYELEALDKERIKALTKKYLETVKNAATGKRLHINLKSLSSSESETLAEIKQMPMVYLMREVLTALEMYPNAAEYSTNIRLMNAHVVTTLNDIAKHLPSAPKKTADADAQSEPQGAAQATTNLDTITDGERFKLAGERDFRMLDPEPGASAVGAQAGAAQPGGAHGASESQDSSGVSGSTIGGIIGGGIGGTAALAVGSFLFHCSPGCLSLLSKLARATEVGEDAADRIFNRLSQNAGENAGEEFGEEFGEKAGEKGGEETGEEVAEKTLKKVGKKAGKGKQAARCTRSVGSCKLEDGENDPVETDGETGGGGGGGGAGAAGAASEAGEVAGEVGGSIGAGVVGLNKAAKTLKKLYEAIKKAIEKNHKKHSEKQVSHGSTAKPNQPPIKKAIAAEHTTIQPTTKPVTSSSTANSNNINAGIATVPDDATSVDQPTGTLTTVITREPSTSTEPSTSKTDTAGTIPKTGDDDSSQSAADFTSSAPATTQAAESTNQPIATSTPEAITQEAKKSTSDILNGATAASPPSETSTVIGTSPSVTSSASGTTTQTTINEKSKHPSTARQIASATSETITAEVNSGIPDSTTASPTSTDGSTAAQARQSKQSAPPDTAKQSVISGSRDSSAASPSMTPASTGTTAEQTTTKQSIPQAITTQEKARSTSDTTSQKMTSGISGSTTIASPLTETSTATETTQSTKLTATATTQATIDKTAILQSTTGQAALSSATTATGGDPGISDSTTASPTSATISTAAQARQSSQAATTIHGTTAQTVTSGSTDSSAASSSMTPASTGTTAEQTTTRQSITQATTQEKARSTSDITSQTMTSGISDSTTTASPLTETSTPTETTQSTQSPATAITQATIDKTAILKTTTGQAALSSATAATGGDPGISDSTTASPTSTTISTAATTRQLSQTTTPTFGTNTQTATSGFRDSSAASLTPASTGSATEQTTAQQSITQEKTQSKSNTGLQGTSGFTDSTTAAPTSTTMSAAAQTRQSSQAATPTLETTTQTATSSFGKSSAASPSLTPASTGSATEQTTAQQSLTQEKAQSTSVSPGLQGTSGIPDNTMAAATLAQASSPAGAGTGSSLTSSASATTTQTTINEKSIHPSTDRQIASATSETITAEVNSGISEHTTASPTSTDGSTAAQARQSKQSAPLGTAKQTVISGSRDSSAASPSMTPASTGTTAEQTTTQQSITQATTQEKARSTSDTTSQKMTSAILGSTTTASPLTETSTATGTTPFTKTPTAVTNQATIDKTAILQSTTGQPALSSATAATGGDPGISDSTTASPTLTTISTAATIRQLSQTTTPTFGTNTQTATSGFRDSSAASLTPASTGSATEQTTAQQSLTQEKAQSTSVSPGLQGTSGIPDNTMAAATLAQASSPAGTGSSLTSSASATTTQTTINEKSIHPSIAQQIASATSETITAEVNSGISEHTTASPTSTDGSTAVQARQSKQSAPLGTAKQTVISGSRDSSAASPSMTPASTGTTAEQTTTQQSITQATTQEKTRSTSDTTSQKMTSAILGSTTTASPLTETSTATGTTPFTKTPTAVTNQATIDKTAILQSTTGQPALSSVTTVTGGDPGISDSTTASPTSTTTSTAAQARQSSQAATTIHDTTSQTVTSGSTDSSAASSSMTPASTGMTTEQTTTRQSITQAITQEKARSTSDITSQTMTSGISDSTTTASPLTETSTATETIPSTKSPATAITQAAIDKTAILQSTTGQPALSSATTATGGDPGISDSTTASPTSTTISTAAQAGQSSQAALTIHDTTAQTVTSGSTDSSAASPSLTPASTGTAVEKTTTTTTTTPVSTPQEQTASISNRTNPTENTTATATTNATPLPKTESVNNQRLRLSIKSFTDKCKTIHSRFNKNMAKIYADTRNKVRQAPATEGQPLDCLGKGILPRESLHQLNQQFSNKFLNIYENAHKFMKHLTPAAISEKNHRTPQSIISDRVISEFRTMYATFSNIRQQMLSDLGCSNQQPLDRAAIIRLSSGVYTPPATASVNTDHLLKAIEEQPQSANPDGFDRFLNDLSQILHGKTGQEQQTTPETGNSRPQEKPEPAEKAKKLSSDIIDRQHRHHNQQLLIRILQQEQALFLENIQQPDINPVRKLQGNTAPTPPSHGMTSVQPDPGKTSTPSAIASTPSSNSQTASRAITPTNYPLTDNLTLANMLAAKISDRPIHLNHTMAPGTPGKNATSLDQSPGMQLLTNSLALARQLRTELTALANDLATLDKKVNTQCDQDDLINLAIIQTLPEASAGKATENFLSSVLTSTTLGIQHQKPDNIFRADGSLRGTSQAPGTPLFYDPSTGQTIDHGATRQLASVMLKAMAASRLAEQTINDDIPQHLSKKIIDQVAQLKNHQPKSWATRFSQWLGLEQGSQASTRSSLATRFKQRLSFSKSIKITPPTDMPLVKGLASGRYHQTQSRFMKLAPARQLELLKSLASSPDYLGLDHYAEPLARLEDDVAVATQTPSPIPAGSDQPSDRQPPDWQTFQLDQRAWQLFTHLYNARFEAPAEAMERIKTAALIQRQGIEPHPDEAQRLNQLVITLLPVRTSASDRAQLINTRGKALPKPVRLHQFNQQRITEILSSYATIKSLVSRQFPQIFGDRVSDARLKDELVSQIARASLQKLKGKTTTGQWQQAVTRQMEREFDDFRSDQAEAS